MDFYRHQDKARQNTKSLILLFILSLGLVTTSIYAALKFSLYVSRPRQTRNQAYQDTMLSDWSFASSECQAALQDYTYILKLNSSRSSRLFRNSYSRRRYYSSRDVEMVQTDKAIKDQKVQKECNIKKALTFSWWDSGMFMWVALATTTVVGGMSLSKMSNLKHGGSVVALEMGGRLLLPETANDEEKQLLNIVEEMALAAGIPKPDVYLLDRESGINAFAAGYKVDDAVVGVTRGALEAFNRDELQAVIGHEFSHILNGDMRMNIRISSIIYGLISIYLLGRICLRGSYYSDSRENRFLLAFGFSLIAIGCIGMLCGRILKSAISRQREFLADASSVQFTRNAEGMASALMTIQRDSFGSLVNTPYAEAHSHMLFGNALNLNDGSLFDTHPPLKERIRRIKGRISRNKARSSSAKVSNNNNNIDNAINEMTMGFAQGNSIAANIPPNTNDSDEDSIVESNPVNKVELPYWWSKLPEVIQEALKEPESSVLVLFALCLDSENREAQKKYLQKQDSSLSIEKILELESSLQSVNSKLYLPIVDQIAIALRETDSEKLEKSLEQVRNLGQIKFNQDWTIKGFAVYTTLQRGLKPEAFSNSNNDHTLDRIWIDCLKILSMLAQVGESNEDNIDYAFRTGAFLLSRVSKNNIPKTRVSCDLDLLQSSLRYVAQTNQELKKKIVYAAVETVMSKGAIKEAEIMLLGVIARKLDCAFPAIIKP